MISKILSIFKFIINHPLNKKNKFKALVRFVKWQLGAKLIDGKFVIDWVDEAKFITRKGETGLTGNLYCGFMEYEDMAFLLHYIRKSDEFYDIGANVGAYTILASAVRKCRSHTFEPLPDTFDRLTDQIKINRIEGLVNAHNKGVGSEADVIEFTNTFNCMNHVNTDPNNKDITKVPVIKLDDEFYPTSNSVIKIDVEGYESFVLDGGQKFFSNPLVSALIVETNGSGDRFGITDNDIDKIIRNFGFFPIEYIPISRAVSEIETFNSGGNTIYVKDLVSVSERCRNADRVIVHTAGNLSL